MERKRAMVDIFSLPCCQIAFSLPGLGLPVGHSAGQGLAWLPAPAHSYPPCLGVHPFSLLVNAVSPPTTSPFVSVLHKPSRPGVSLWPLIRFVSLKTPDLKLTATAKKSIPPVGAFWPAQSLARRHLPALHCGLVTKVCLVSLDRLKD